MINVDANETETINDFISNSLRTLSDKFYGSRIPVVALINAVAHFVEAGERLDVLKKAIFYGRDIPPGLFEQLGVSRFEATVVCMSDDVPEYERTLLHGILGVATEAAEMADILKGYLLGETLAMDPVHIKEESGDAFWYYAIIFDKLRTTFPAEMDRVIRKLIMRYPEKFTEHFANQRDLFAERKELEREQDIGDVSAWDFKAMCAIIESFPFSNDDTLIAQFRAEHGNEGKRSRGDYMRRLVAASRLPSNERIATQ